jgi:hypothetical protein
MGTTNICGFETGEFTEGTLNGTPTGSIQTGTVRSGTYAFRSNPTTTSTGYFALGGIASDGSTGGNVAFNLATAFYRFYFRYHVKPASGDEDIFWAATSGFGRKLNIALNSAGKLVVYDRTRTLVTTGTTVLNADQWYRINVKSGTGATAAWELLIDGASEASGTADQSSSNNGLGLFGKVLNSSNQTVDFFYDDIVIDDSAEPGAGQVGVMIPASDGTFTAWTIGAGSGSKWQQLTDIPNNGDTSYLVSTAVVNGTYTAQMQTGSAAGITGTLNRVKALALMKRDGGSNGSVKLRFRSGSTDSDSGANFASTGSYTLAASVFDTDPATSAAWASVDSLQVGAIEESGSNKTRMTEALVMVDFVFVSPTNTFSPQPSTSPFLQPNPIDPSPSSFSLSRPIPTVPPPPALPVGVFASSSAGPLQPNPIDPAPSSVRISDIIRTVPAVVNTWLPYFSSAPVIQPIDMAAQNLIRVSQPTPPPLAPITNFDRFSSMPFLKPNPPELPKQLVVSEPALPFFYNAPGWLLSLPVVALWPAEIPRAQLEIFKPTPAVPPVVFPRGTLYIAPLRIPDLPASSISFPPFPAVAPIPPVIGCNLTLFMLLERLYKNLDEDTNFPVYYPRDMAVFCLNWAQRLFCLLTLCLEKTVSFTLGANTAHYKISDQIPDFIVPLRVSFNGVRVRPRKLGDLDRLGAWSRALVTDGGQTPATIKYYAQHGMDGLAIYPSLTGSGTLSITYAAIPPDLVANSDIPVIQPEQQVHLPDLATWLIRLPEGAIEGVDLTQMPGQRGLEAMAKYAEFVRARVKGLAYDYEPPLDVKLQDISRLFFKPKREKLG